MTIYERGITALIENDEELRAIMHKIGVNYIPSNLTDEEIMLLTCYIRVLLTYCNGDYSSAYVDTMTIYNYLGGNSSDYYEILESAEEDGIIGSFFTTTDFEKRNKVKVPVISGFKGFESLQKILGKMSGGKSRLILAGTKFQSRMNFVEFLSELPKNNEIKLADSYISSTTLHPFSFLKGKVGKIRILTSKITGVDSIFKNDVLDFVKETNIELEIRRNSDIHDRYLIAGNEVWSIGTSIKDLGNKDAIITQIETVKDSIADLFEIRWAESKKIEVS